MMRRRTSTSKILLAVLLPVILLLLLGRSSCASALPASANSVNSPNPSPKNCKIYKQCKKIFKKDCLLENGCPGLLNPTLGLPFAAKDTTSYLKCKKKCTKDARQVCQKKYPAHYGEACEWFYRADISEDDEDDIDDRDMDIYGRTAGGAAAGDRVFSAATTTGINAEEKKSNDEQFIEHLVNDDEEQEVSSNRGRGGGGGGGIAANADGTTLPDILDGKVLGTGAVPQSATNRIGNPADAGTTLDDIFGGKVLGTGTTPQSAKNRVKSGGNDRVVSPMGRDGYDPGYFSNDEEIAGRNNGYGNAGGDAAIQEGQLSRGYLGVAEDGSTKEQDLDNSNEKEVAEQEQPLGYIDNPRKKKTRWPDDPDFISNDIDFNSIQVDSISDAKPTSTPSKSPVTARPTPMTSESPQSSPSSNPSFSPSSLPSLDPSSESSGTPSETPSSLPSLQPSGSPSESPQSSPSSNPSFSPSSLPSLDPSSEPSGTPSETPSSLPSLQPSGSPSESPQSSPSSNPSFSPSSLPSLDPSSESSGTPSETPSSLPSLQPSGSPSESPQSSPSSNPSFSPSSLPSLDPSSEPSGTPSETPSSLPSLQPSGSPSESPQSSPSSNPSFSPSLLPSLDPSSEPSGTPSETPSSLPSLQPSGSPSESPQSSPSSNPSSSPSSLPSLDPSSEPSGTPSETPSLLPSLQPSGSPSESPVIATPTSMPSRSPVSAEPSPRPTALPTTSSPTFVPSQTPTVADAQTDSPTKSPTKNSIAEELVETTPDNTVIDESNVTKEAEESVTEDSTIPATSTTKGDDITATQESDNTVQDMIKQILGFMEEEGGAASLDEGDLHVTESTTTMEKQPATRDQSTTTTADDKEEELTEIEGEGAASDETEAIEEVLSIQDTETAEAEIETKSEVETEAVTVEVSPAELSAEVEQWLDEAEEEIEGTEEGSTFSSGALQGTSGEKYRFIYVDLPSLLLSVTTNEINGDSTTDIDHLLPLIEKHLTHTIKELLLNVENPSDAEAALMLGFRRVILQRDNNFSKGGGGERYRRLQDEENAGARLEVVLNCAAELYQTLIAYSSVSVGSLKDGLVGYLKAAVEQVQFTSLLSEIQEIENAGSLVQTADLEIKVIDSDIQSAHGTFGEERANIPAIQNANVDGKNNPENETTFWEIFDSNAIRGLVIGTIAFVSIVFVAAAYFLVRKPRPYVSSMRRKKSKPLASQVADCAQPTTLDQNWLMLPPMSASHDDDAASGSADAPRLSSIEPYLFDATDDSEGNSTPPLNPLSEEARLIRSLSLQKEKAYANAQKQDKEKENATAASVGTSATVQLSAKEITWADYLPNLFVDKKQTAAKKVEKEGDKNAKPPAMEVITPSRTEDNPEEVLSAGDVSDMTWEANGSLYDDEGTKLVKKQGPNNIRSQKYSLRMHDQAIKTITEMPERSQVKSQDKPPPDPPAGKERSEIKDVLKDLLFVEV